MIYAVIDTNVLVSALLTHHKEASTAKVVELLLEGGFIPLYDENIIEEYEEVLHRAKFNLLSGVADSLISFIVEHGIETSRSAFVESMPDEDDRVFYEVALSNEESFLVTGNLKHYPQTPKVVSPTDFVNMIKNLQKTNTI